MRKSKRAKYAPRTPICLEEMVVYHLNATLENVPPTIATKKRDRVIGGLVTYMIHNARITYFNCRPVMWGLVGAWLVLR